MSYLVTAFYEDEYYSYRFQGYTKREAIRLFREHYGLTGKRLEYISCKPINLI